MVEEMKSSFFEKIIGIVIIIESIFILGLVGIFLLEDIVIISLSLFQFFGNRSGTTELVLEDNFRYLKQFLNLEFIFFFVDRILLLIGSIFGFITSGLIFSDSIKIKKYSRIFLIIVSFLLIIFYFGISRGLVFYNLIFYGIIVSVIFNLIALVYFFIKK